MSPTCLYLSLKLRNSKMNQRLNNQIQNLNKQKLKLNHRIMNKSLKKFSQRSKETSLVGPQSQLIQSHQASLTRE